jgi:hypothetical protein
MVINTTNVSALWLFVNLEKSLKSEIIPSKSIFTLKKVVEVC